MNLFDKILTTKELTEKPPVLIDIGASGKLHQAWKKISQHSICIAFDADERKFGFVKEETGRFKKLIIYNCIVTNTDEGEADFYLTKSPYCSSLLEPDKESLNCWAFSDLFTVEKKIKMTTRSLNSILRESKVDYIDWFKTDSQGIDLRLFASLPGDIASKTLVAEFEPGIIDAYRGEDKLFKLMEYMNDKKFWISEMKIKGTIRLSADMMNELARNITIQKFLQFSMKISPGWAEVTYVNSFDGRFGKREYLLGWIFATISKQYGFALNLAEQGYTRFKDKIFLEMKVQSKRRIKIDLIKLKFLPSLINKIISIFK